MDYIGLPELLPGQRSVLGLTSTVARRLVVPVFLMVGATSSSVPAAADEEVAPEDALSFLLL